MKVGGHADEVCDEFASGRPVFKGPLGIEIALRPGDHAHVVVPAEGGYVVNSISNVFLRPSQPQVCTTDPTAVRPSATTYRAFLSISEQVPRDIQPNRITIR